jgi:uncharacterized protein (DUF4213/DUF364 family)
MFKLYDDLCIGIPSGIKISDCVIGEKWTTVWANGNAGVARTLEMPENPVEFAGKFIGAYLRDTGNHMKWDSLMRASTGIAALNAWYNTAERANGLDGDAKVEAPGGNVVYVGDYPSALPLPLSPDFDEDAYEALRRMDTVVISADALITRALPKLLDIAGENEVILEGWSLPCTALFFAFKMPVKELRGCYLRVIEGIDDLASSAVAFCVKRPQPEKNSKVLRVS